MTSERSALTRFLARFPQIIHLNSSCHPAWDGVFFMPQRTMRNRVPSFVLHHGQQPWRADKHALRLSGEIWAFFRFISNF